MSRKPSKTTYLLNLSTQTTSMKIRSDNARPSLVHSAINSRWFFTDILNPCTFNPRIKSHKRSNGSCFDRKPISPAYVRTVCLREKSCKCFPPLTEEKAERRPVHRLHKSIIGSKPQQESCKLLIIISRH